MANVVRLRMAEQEIKERSLQDRFDVLMQMTFSPAALAGNQEFLAELATSMLEEIDKKLEGPMEFDEREELIGLREHVESQERIIRNAALLSQNTIFTNVHTFRSAAAFLHKSASDQTVEFVQQPEESGEDSSKPSDDGQDQRQAA